MKLKDKLITLSALICVLGILAMSTVYYFLAVMKLEAQIDTSSRLYTSNIAKDIDKSIALQKSSLEDTLSSIVYFNRYEHDFLQNYLVYKNEMNAHNSYYIAFSDKEFIDSATWTPDEDYDPTARPWYTEAIQGDEVCVSDPYVDADTGKVIITLSKAFKTVDGREGVIASDIKIDALIQLVSTVELTEGAYGFLLDDNGNIMSHQNPEFNPTDTKLTNIDRILDGKLLTVMDSSLKIDEKILTDYDGTEKSFLFADITESNWKVGIALPTSYTVGTIDVITKYTVVSLISVTLVSILLSTFMANSITKPISHTALIANDIGNLDLSKSIEEDQLKRKDEIGQMYRSFQMIIEKLRAFMLDMNSSVAINQEVYKETVEKLEFLVTQAEETSATTQELSAGMEQAEASTSLISTSTDEIDLAISDFATKVDECAITSSSISTKADTLNTQFIEAKNRSMEIYTQAKGEINKAIEASKEVDKINSLTNAILDISNQTSLLSLNASIEAARAGESGRGFAVVANEIGKLANNSNATVEQIQEVTATITTAVNQLIDRVNHVMSFIERDVIQDYELMVDAINNYKEDGHFLNNIITDLSSTSEELSATISDVSASINEIAITVEEATKATTNIAEKNTDISEAVYNINKIMERNKEVSAKLEDIVVQVKL